MFDVYYDYQIFNEQKVGGVSRYFIELQKQISKSDKYNPIILAPIHKNQYLTSGLRLPDSKLFYNRITRRFYEKFNQIICSKKMGNNQIKIVHPTWVNPYIYELKNSYLIVTIYDMIHELFLEKNDFILREIERKKEAIYKADIIIAISQSTKRDILKFYPDINEDKIKVIYLGVDRLVNKDKKMVNIPKRFLLFVGKRIEYKGIKLFNELMIKLNKKYNDLYYIFAGSIKPCEEEIEYYKNCGILDKILFLNPSDEELAYLYAKAECFVYPSLYEGFGLPILEAFDNDCPVVCTNSSSLPEVGGDAALYFDVDDVDGCYQRVISVIDNIEYRKEIIRKGKQQVEKFSWEKTARDTIEIYDAVIARNIKNEM